MEKQDVKIKQIDTRLAGEKSANLIKALGTVVAAGAVAVLSGCGGGEYSLFNDNTSMDGGSDAVTSEGSAGEGGADASDVNDAGKDQTDSGFDTNDVKDAVADEGSQDCTVKVEAQMPSGSNVDKGQQDVKMACVGITPSCQTKLTSVIADEMYYQAEGVLADGKVWVGSVLKDQGVNGVNVGQGDNKYISNLNVNLPANKTTLVCTGGDVKDADSGVNGGANEVMEVVTDPPNSGGAYSGSTFTINI